MVSSYTHKDSRSTMFRPALAQSFWRPLRNKPGEFTTLCPYIVMLFDCEYEQELFPRLNPLLEEVYKIDEELGFHLYNKSFDILFSKFKDANPSNQIHFRFNVEIFRKLAKTDPEKYLEIVKKIVVLWEKSGNFGYLTDIFLPFNEVCDPEKREKIRIEFAQIYLKMLNLSPFINNQAISDALKLEGPDNPMVKTDLGQITAILSDVFKPSLITAITLPKRIDDLDDKEDTIERFQFLYQELFGKVTLEISQREGRYLSPTEIELISARLKAYLKEQGF